MAPPSELMRNILAKKPVPVDRRRPEGLKQSAGRHRIFCIPLNLPSPTKDFFI